MQKNKKDSSEVQQNIESHEIIKEVFSKSYEVVRLSRIKYLGNKYNFIDIRYYQRGYDDNENEIYYPTKKGVQIKEELFKQIFDRYFIEDVYKILDT